MFLLLIDIIVVLIFRFTIVLPSTRYPTLLYQPQDLLPTSYSNLPVPSVLRNTPSAAGQFFNY